jgi:Ni/Co efflux regulator RcnB
MNFFTMKKIMLGLAVTAMVAGGIPLAAAQGASDAAAAVATPASGTTAKPTKAERKAARKQARAKKNAELKKLEAAGYQPGKSDPNYPTDLQNAQKKAGIGTGASQ